MFLEDELEYVRLKRADNIMGWLAILFVAALVFMFAGLMNSASASAEARPAPAPLVQSVDLAGNPDIVTLNSLFRTAPASATLMDQSEAVRQVAFPMHLGKTSDVLGGSQGATAEVASLERGTTTFEAPRTAALADRNIMIGFMLLAFSLMGASFVTLAFGGPRDMAMAEENGDAY
jgi:hypothetical protein